MNGNYGVLLDASSAWRAERSGDQCRDRVELTSLFLLVGSGNLLCYSVSNLLMLPSQRCPMSSIVG